MRNEKHVCIMKTKLVSLLVGLCSALAALAAAGPTDAPPASSSANPSERVGIYDSRVIAYACFWSTPQRQLRDTLIAEAKAAKSAGDTARFHELGAQLSAAQAARMTRFPI